MNTFDHAGNHEHHAAHAHDHPSTLVTRCFFMEGLKDDLQASTILDILTPQSGVHHVRLDPRHHWACVDYDNTIIDVEAVIEALRNAGHPPRQRFWDRLKYGWWRYLDENARSNTTSASSSCCSNPAALHAQRQRC
ncbi:MAG: cation transporter [Gammaproteobacteria bacterium]|nr:cation transporter [Gammaproteobacteria bacterium]